MSDPHLAFRVERSRPRQMDGQRHEWFQVTVNGRDVGRLLLEQHEFNRLAALAKMLDAYRESHGRELALSMLNIAAGLEGPDRPPHSGQRTLT